MPSRIFISYRVEDTGQSARALKDDLDRQLAGAEVFLDHRSLEPGESWPDRLRQEVASADLVFVLIGSRWLTLQQSDGSGIRRLDAPGDWVRQEIEAALDTGRRVVPVLVDNAAPLTAAAFVTTPRISGLSELQASKLTMIRWPEDLGLLVDTLVRFGFTRRPISAVRVPGASANSRSTVPARGNAPFEGREALLAGLAVDLQDRGASQFLVLHGAPGVGKSELAREYARLHLADYPGGTFSISVHDSGPPVDLATLGRVVLGLIFPPDLDLANQCLRSLLSLGDAACLLIYDNAVSPESVEAWLPSAGAPRHVIVTSNWERWDSRWKCILVPPLTDAEATRLVKRVAGADVARSHGPMIVEQAGGLPVQLLPAARNLAEAVRRHGMAGEPAGLTDEAQATFAGPWARIGDDARLLLAAALQFHPATIDRDLLRGAFERAGVLSPKQFTDALDRCLDLFLLTGVNPLRLHGLLARFVRQHAGDVAAIRLDPVRRALWAGFVEAARAVIANPARTESVSSLTVFVTTAGAWGASPADTAVTLPDALAAGHTLFEIGRFAEAQSWFDRALTHARQENESSNLASVRAALHGIGDCLLSLGKTDLALAHFEQAVAAAEAGVAAGTVTQALLGEGLHQVGNCLRLLGRPDSGLWAERAVAAAEKGDFTGKIDYRTLGISLQLVGLCHVSLEEFREAQRWFERAIEVKQRGDPEGRLDYESLGVSLHSLGHCLWMAEKFAEARPWFERAVEAADRGDRHGRIDHESLAKSLHMVGRCLLSTGDYSGALGWFERSVAAAGQGDLHGRVDHDSVGRTVQQAAMALARIGRLDEARLYFDRALAEKQLGDIHGVVDAAGLETIRAAAAATLPDQ